MGMLVPTYALDIKLNEAILELETAPELINNSIYVPFREIAERISANVDWDDATSTVTATRGGTMVSFAIGDTNLTVNGEETAQQPPVILKDNKTLVPVRAFTEAFGARVEWDDKSQTASISITNPDTSEIAAIEKTFTMNTGNVSAKVTYPVISSKALSEKILDTASKRAVAKTSGMPEGTLYEAKYTVKYYDNKVLSVYGEETSYTEGSAHPNNTVNTIVLDVKTGEELSPTKVLGKDYNMVESAREAFLKEIENNKESYFSTASDTINSLKSFAYYIDTDGKVNFVIDENIIAPHAAGPITVSDGSKIK